MSTRVLTTWCLVAVIDFHIAEFGPLKCLPKVTSRNFGYLRVTPGSVFQYLTSELALS